MSEVALEVGGSFRSHQEPSKSEERRAANSGHREGPQFVCWLNACMLKSRTMAVSTPGTSRECFKSKAMLYGRRIPWQKQRLDTNNSGHIFRSVSSLHKPKVALPHTKRQIVR